MCFFLVIGVVEEVVLVGSVDFDGVLVGFVYW